MTQHCGRTQPHPTHKAMTGRHAYQCPGNPFVPTETQPEPAQPWHTVDEELRHLRIAQAGHDLALQAACRKTEEQRQRAEQAEAARNQLRTERDALAAEVPLICSDDRHKTKVAALEADLARAEQLATDLRAALDGPTPTEPKDDTP